VQEYPFSSLVRKMAKTRRRNSKKSIPPPGPSQCHPRVGQTRPPVGCLPLSSYKEIAKSLGVSTEQSPGALRAELDAKLNVQPGQEYSFLQASPLSASDKDSLAKQYLRPKMPDAWKSDPDQWLDSLNIESVMKQYEETNPEFEFMGPFPIDFAAPDPYVKGGSKCLIREICDLDVNRFFKEGKKYVGIVYNLDPHFKGGSHWIASFIDIPKHKCFYFDSYGMKPPKPIETFMKWLTTQDPQMKLYYNSRRFQFNGSECGVYSLYFIIRMLAQEPFRTFCRRAPRDSAMLDIRDELFST
jgi:hypothetical protein